MNETENKWKKHIAPIVLLAGAALLAPTAADAAALNAQEPAVTCMDETPAPCGTAAGMDAGNAPLNPAAKIAPVWYREQINETARADYLMAREKLREGWKRLLAKNPEKRTIDAAIRADYSAAMEALNQSLHIAPRYLRSYVLGSLIYRSYGGGAQAERYARQALGLARLRLERDPGDVGAHLIIAVTGTMGEARFWPEAEPWRLMGQEEARRVLVLCGGARGGQTGYSLPDLSTEQIFPNFDTCQPAAAEKIVMNESDRAFCGLLAAAVLGDGRAATLAEAAASHVPEDSPRRSLIYEARKAAELDGAAGGKGEHTRAFLLKCLLALPEEIGLGK